MRRGLRTAAAAAGVTAALAAGAVLPSVAGADVPVARGVVPGGYAYESPYGPTDLSGCCDSPILPAQPTDPATGAVGTSPGEPCTAVATCP